MQKWEGGGQRTEGGSGRAEERWWGGESRARGGVWGRQEKPGAGNECKKRVG